MPTLDSIAVQQNVELVVVDNGSTDDTKRVLADWRNTAAIPVTLVEEPNPGLARARNAGVSKATGDIFAFTDDDCTLSLDHSIKVAAAFSGGASLIVGGKVKLGDPLDAPVTIKLDNLPTTLTDLPDVCGFLHGCNMAMPREVYARVGVFDEMFGAGALFVSAEDTDYLYRAARLGIPVRYDPAIEVTHFHGRRNPTDVMKLKRGYAVGKGALAVKHRDLTFIKNSYWSAKGALHDALKFRRRPKDPFHYPYPREFTAMMVGALKALRR